MSSNYYMGLDASLTHTGIVVLDDQGKLQQQLTIETKPISAIGSRLAFIEGRVEKVVNEFPPVRACIEGGAFAAKFGAFGLGKVAGVLDLFFWREKIPLDTVPPTTLKKWIIGKGAGDKNVVMREAFKKWGFEGDDHQTDAYGLAHIARAMSCPELYNKLYEKEVIAGLRQKMVAS